MTKIKQILKQNNLFGRLSDDELTQIADASNLITCSQGEVICRQNTIEKCSFCVVSGSFRLLTSNPISNELYTVGRANKDEIIGLIDLLSQGSCEIAIARQTSEVISIDNKVLLDVLRRGSNAKKFSDCESPCEKASILTIISDNLIPAPVDIEQWVIENLPNIDCGVEWNNSNSQDIYLSTRSRYSQQYEGKTITFEEKIELEKNHPIIALRFCRYTKKEDSVLNESNNPKKNPSKEEIQSEGRNKYTYEEFDHKLLGIAEAKDEYALEGIKLIRGKGIVNANMAVIRMIANAYNIPVPVDVIEKTLEAQESKNSSVPTYLMGQIFEMMGFQTQLGNIENKNLVKLELPCLIKYNSRFSIITTANNETITIADPENGWKVIDINELNDRETPESEVCLIKPLEEAASKQFGWSWFKPSIKKYKWSLLQVLLASLFIQLFQLANPLLLQQIIDKVINQSNLSALQVLGAALVLAAVLQGILTAVRTWLLIDTTDRMDLMLGTQVIDKLLRLPLRFFEKRPVGELSQRLGELSNLRSFLTGTAITSTLDLLFAFIYIFIMFNYSPFLTLIALSTIPLYVAMILGIAPIYRRLIRKQAEFNAKTQSHLIETLSGIQTVKAQHVELGSRWKWQERYSDQIAEGFKSVVLGSSVGEVGNFLNQVSSLLVLWVGVYQVVNGDLSLGQLIAFRIIAGYVTGPILRLSGLWQGFQQVSISMERLSDIVDQKAESDISNRDQIGLPSIKGNVTFENVKFKFGNGSTYQVNGVDLNIVENSFVGIVGQSGSGKSTLMKLIPRLYKPESGRILIDGYDINKVNLDSVREQIGIVPQDCLLFEGTIRENICMNAPDSKNEVIIAASRAACAHDFIMDLPDGYATRIGERGAGLSGGQKQRIAIARTLLQNPNLLILDEATSALDYDTESNVCMNLQERLEGKTVFFITHRLSTVKNADLIVLMHEGKVEEVGSHEELISCDGRYAALYAHQGDE